MVRILLAEDDDSVRGRLAELLADELPGVVIREAGTARTAFELGSAEPWSLIILDIHLPDGSGLKVLNALQLLGRDTPVVIVSGLPGTAYADAALRLGARAFVSKDRISEELLGVVREMLGSAP